MCLSLNHNIKLLWIKKDTGLTEKTGKGLEIILFLIIYKKNIVNLKIYNSDLKTNLISLSEEL